jgi:hypothetical protein
MNIFYLSEDITKCAEYHVDKHIVKMPLETAQLLCTVHWVSGGFYWCFEKDFSNFVIPPFRLNYKKNKNYAPIP